MAVPAVGHDPMSMTDYVATELRSLMGRHRVSQRQLADHLQLSQTAMSMRLRGRTPFDVNELGALAAYFGVAPADLLPPRVRPADEVSVTHA